MERKPIKGLILYEYRYTAQEQKTQELRNFVVSAPSKNIANLLLSDMIRTETAGGVWQVLPTGQSVTHFGLNEVRIDL